MAQRKIGAARKAGGSTSKAASTRTTASKTNVTLRVRNEALQAARTLAATEGVSMSALFEQLAEERAGRAATRTAAKRELIALAENGLDLGGAPYLTRDRAHER